MERAVEIGGFAMHVAQDRCCLGRVVVVDVGAALGLEVRGPLGAVPQAMAAWHVRGKGLARALAQAASRIGGHRALQAPHAALMELPRRSAAGILDAPRLRQRAQSDARMPGTVGARPARGVAGEDGADPPCTDGRQPWAPARARVAARPTPAHGLSEDADVGNPQPAGVLREDRVPPWALGVRPAVMPRRLATIDGGVTWERDGVQLGAHGSPPRSGHCG
jgi:hypothetical protein